MFKGPPKKARADSGAGSTSKDKIDDMGDDVPSGAQDLLALVMGGGGGGGGDDDDDNKPS